MGCSAAFHLFHVRSESIFNLLSRLDYGGISILIFGGATPIIYYSYACEASYTARWVWITLLGIASLGCFIASLIPSFDQPEYRTIRGIMFLALGCSPVLMIIHFFYDMDPSKLPLDLTWFVVGGYLYIQGAVLYIVRVPERCKPGKFDFCGASH